MRMISQVMKREIKKNMLQPANKSMLQNKNSTRGTSALVQTTHLHAWTRRVDAPKWRLKTKTNSLAMKNHQNKCLAPLFGKKVETKINAADETKVKQNSHKENNNLSTALAAQQMRSNHETEILWTHNKVITKIARNH